MRVLYVEDDDNLALAVEQMLMQEGHRCDRVRSGAGAVKLGQTREYDLILLDVMLPDVDGYEVLRQLQDAGVETPVLIQSGLVERDRAMDGLGFGVDDYLIKPFNREELIRRVEQTLARVGKTVTPVRDDSIIELPPPKEPPMAEPPSDMAPLQGPPPEEPPSEEPPSDETPSDGTPSDGAPSDGTPLPQSFPSLAASIVAEDGPGGIDCIVVSVNSGGAVLDLHDETIVCPQEFKLAVAGDKSFRCQSCWRHGAKVGVKFV